MLVTAYPNPANNQLNFVSKINTTQTAIVNIYDSKGILLQIFSIQGNNTHTLNTNQWQTGMYYYTTTIDGTITQHSKLIIIK